MKAKILITALSALALHTAVAQSGKQKLDKAEKQATAERQRSFGAKRTENELKDDRNDLPKNQKNKLGDGTTRSEQNDPKGTTDREPSTVEANEDQGAGAQGDAADSSGNQSATSAVIQRTTSESGSPAILTEDSVRDGTNNVQRANMNTGGAKVKGNMHLEKNTHAEKNANTGVRVRKEEEIPGTGPDRTPADKKVFGGNGKRDSKNAKDTSKKSKTVQKRNG